MGAQEIDQVSEIQVRPLTVKCGNCLLAEQERRREDTESLTINSCGDPVVPAMKVRGVKGHSGS